MAAREIKFRDHCGDLVGRQNGMVFIIRTEPGVIAGTPAHWVTVIPGDGAPDFSTMGHQYFHLDEAKEFCQQIAAGEIDLTVLRAQYDAEDVEAPPGRERRAYGMTEQDVLVELDALRDLVKKLPEGADMLDVRITEICSGVETSIHLWNPDIRELAGLFGGASLICNSSSGRLSFTAGGVQVYRYEKFPWASFPLWAWKSPGGVEAPPGRASQKAYRENMSIIPQERTVCKGVFG